MYVYKNLGCKNCMLFSLYINIQTIQCFCQGLRLAKLKMLVAVILKRFCLKMQTQLTFSILISLLLQSYNGWRSTLPNRLLPNSLVMIGRKLDFILQQYTCAAYFQLKILRAFYSSPLQILSFYKKISGEHRCCCTSYSLNRFGFQNRETRKRLALSYFPQN